MMAQAGAVVVAMEEVGADHKEAKEEEKEAGEAAKVVEEAKEAE